MKQETMPPADAGADSSSSDDDNVPLGARRMARRTPTGAGDTKKPPAAAASADGSSDDGDDVPLTKRMKKTPAKREAKQKKTPVKRKSPAKRKATPRVKAEVKEEEASSSSSDDEPLSQRSRGSAAATPSRGRKRKAVNYGEASSSSSSSDDEPLSQRSRGSGAGGANKKKAKATPSRKRKRVAVKKEEEESDSSSSDDEPLSQMASKKRKAAAAKRKKKATPARKKKKVEPKKKKKKEPPAPVRKWWLEPPLPEGEKWRTLSHNAVLFPPPYKPHGVPLVYGGKKIKLLPEGEEVATWFAQMIETEHAKKKIFQKNFFTGFREAMQRSKDPAYKVVKSFSKCDFSLLNAWCVAQKEAKAARSKEAKLKEKEEKAKLVEKFGFAMVDGFKEKIGNFMVEPPGLFRGRGEHPLTGTVKKRVMPEDIILNLGKEAPVPPVPMAGHKWGGVQHNKGATWLAFWRDPVQGESKYVWLSPSSKFRGLADMKKYEKARELKKYVGRIRKSYTRGMKSKNEREAQCATATYLIDKLALRVGGEKGDDRADTVGCCSLRAEHIKMLDDDKVELDFLGKDSIRYHNVVTVDKQAWKNLKRFKKGKGSGKDRANTLFDRLTVATLNKSLSSLMKGLSAKVFRTYNASITLDEQLQDVPDDFAEQSVGEKVFFYNMCNRNVAKLCNHQRSLPQNFGEQMGRMDEKLKALAADKKKLTKVLRKLKKGEEVMRTTKSGTKVKYNKDVVARQVESLDKRIQAAELTKETKDQLKTLSLSTSKINYLDPRITAAWCTKWEVPINKVFNKSLVDKFPWALDAKPSYRF